MISMLLSCPSCVNQQTGGNDSIPADAQVTAAYSSYHCPLADIQAHTLIMKMTPSCLRDPILTTSSQVFPTRKLHFFFFSYQILIWQTCHLLIKAAHIFQSSFFNSLIFFLYSLLFVDQKWLVNNRLNLFSLCFLAFQWTSISEKKLQSLILLTSHC